MPNTLPREEFLTVKELTEVAPVSRATVYRMIKDGTGPRARRIGHRVYFARTDVDAWLDAA